MDQTRIGTFIAVLRKEKGLTQKELAEQIGISDKTVSKWETGNGMPDIAYLSPLCEVLDINDKSNFCRVRSFLPKNILERRKKI